MTKVTKKLREKARVQRSKSYREETRRCPECGGKDFHEDALELVCKNCGLVVAERFTRFGFKFER